MNKEKILQAISHLAKSKGFYGRLLNDIMTAPNKDEILDYLESQKFNDPLDMVMFFECC